MSQKIVQCDSCEKVVKQTDAHGWFALQTWSTRPTADQLDQMRQDPFMAAQLQAAGVMAAPPPPHIGGDFCTIDCLMSFVSANKAMLDLGKQPPVPTDPVSPRSALDGYQTEEDEYIHDQEEDPFGEG